MCTCLHLRLAFNAKFDISMKTKVLCFRKLVVTQVRIKVRYAPVLIFWNTAGNGIREFSITLLGYPRRCVLRIITQIYAVYARLVCIGNLVQRAHCYEGTRDARGKDRSRGRRWRWRLRSVVTDQSESEKGGSERGTIGQIPNQHFTICKTTPFRNIAPPLSLFLSLKT